MSIIRNKTLKFVSKLIALVFGIFSFSSCYGIPTALYGIPQAEYKVSGSVRSSATNQVIRDITIEYDPYQVTKSNLDGTYAITVDADSIEQNLQFKFKDTDGTENGEFVDKIITVDFSDVEFTRGNDLQFAGSKSKVIDVNLDPK